MRERIEQYRIIKPTEKELNFFNRWQSQRIKPKWRFIFFHGVLREGLTLLALIKVFQYSFNPTGFELLYSSPSGILFLLFEIIFWLTGGFVIGWFKYNSNEIEFELIKGLKE